MQLEHRLVGGSVDEVLGRDPRRELLLNIELAVVVAGAAFLCLPISRVLEMPQADLHRFGEADFLRRRTLEHLGYVGHDDVLLEDRKSVV